jgi:hypothetical protein
MKPIGKYSCSNNDKKPRILSISDLDTGFDEERRGLWSSYHLKIQSHVGYSITALVALIGLIASSNFLQQIPFLSILTFIASSICAVFFVYLILRILYWSYWEATAVQLSKEQIVEYFNFCNSHCYNYDFLDNISTSAILQLAIRQHLIDEEKKMKWTISTCLRKLAFLTGGIMGIPTYAEPAELSTNSVD